MGYNLYITKKENPSDDAGERISHDEWFDYVDRHAQLKISESMTPTSSSNYVQWGNMDGWWLSWHDGQIDSKNPSCDHIERMIAIASDLGAKVMGEELEQYVANEKGYILEGERGRFLFDRSRKTYTERGYMHYEQVALDTPIEETTREWTPSEERKIAEAAKMLRAAKDADLAMEKKLNRPWWKIWL